MLKDYKSLEMFKLLGLHYSKGNIVFKSKINSKTVKTVEFFKIGKVHLSESEKLNSSKTKTKISEKNLISWNIKDFVVKIWKYES